MAAQLLRTVSADPTTAVPTYTSSSTGTSYPGNSAWDHSSSFGAAGEEVLHTVGALSVSGTSEV